MQGKKKILLLALCLMVLCLTVFLIMDSYPKNNKSNMVGDEAIQNNKTMGNNQQTQNVQSKNEEQNKGTQNETDIQPGQESDKKLEDLLKSYREKRETMTAVKMVDGLLGFGAPNEEDYGMGVGKQDYTSRFDARELGKAYEAAKKYVIETLKISIETKATVYPCIDPRIYTIYEDEDKGAASGYDANNIFICEYCDDGEWQYLILVRDGKGKPWNVIHHGKSYKK